MQEFLISVASGLVVAILSAMFINKERRSPGGMSQSMTTANQGGGYSRVLVAFLIGAAVVFAVLRLIPLSSIQ